MIADRGPVEMEFHTLENSGSAKEALTSWEFFFRYGFSKIFRYLKIKPF